MHDRISFAFDYIRQLHKVIVYHEGFSRLVGIQVRESI
jgi:hypothetical protein